MKLKYVLFLLILLCGGHALAQEDAVEVSVNYKLDKMTTTLDLTDQQQAALRPVIKEYIAQRDAILKGAQDQGVLDHTDINLALKALKDVQDKKFSRILSPEQMKKWQDKEHLLAALNPDGGQSTAEDADTSITPEGADFKF